jgi:hypothetical protein
MAITILDCVYFEVVVLCHTLPERELADLETYLHRRRPEVKILRVLSSNGFEFERREDDSVSSADPERLLKNTQELLERLPHHRLKVISSPEQISQT